MKKLNLKSALLSGLITYGIGIIYFLGSFAFKLLDNPELQGNIVLSIMIIPAAMLGANHYYSRGHNSPSLLLGVFMFLIAILLDAVITVPFFVIPAGGTYLQFYTDPGFWFIGFEYILAVMAYSRFFRKSDNTKDKLFSNPS